MARPTKDELIDRVMEVVNEYLATAADERGKHSVKPNEFLKAIEMLDRMCGYDKSQVSGFITFTRKGADLDE